MNQKPSRLVTASLFITAIPILAINVLFLGVLGWMMYSAFAKSVFLGVFLLVMLGLMIGIAIRIAFAFRKRYQSVRARIR